VKNSTPPCGTSRFNKARVTGRFNAAEDLLLTQRSLAKAGNCWATQERLADLLEMSPQAFAALCGDGQPAIADGDVEALGARFAVPYWRRRIARMEALTTTPMGMRDAAEQAVEAGRAMGVTKTTALHRLKASPIVERVGYGQWALRRANGGAR